MGPGSLKRAHGSAAAALSGSLLEMQSLHFNMIPGNWDLHDSVRSLVQDTAESNLTCAFINKQAVDTNCNGSYSSHYAKKLLGILYKLVFSNLKLD